MSIRPMDEWTFGCPMDISVRPMDEWTYIYVQWTFLFVHWTNGHMNVQWTFLFVQWTFYFYSAKIAVMT